MKERHQNGADDSGVGLNRRQMLEGIGATTLGLGLVAGQASATEPCDGECVCFGKIEGVPELGKTYTFTNGYLTAGVKITDYKRTDDGEVYSVRWEIVDEYLVCKTVVKGGPMSRTRTDFDGNEAAHAAYSSTLTNPNSGKPYEISNITFYFCIPDGKVDKVDHVECKHADTSRSKRRTSKRSTSKRSTSKGSSSKGGKSKRGKSKRGKSKGRKNRGRSGR